jgi:hypothetical protein
MCHAASRQKEGKQMCERSNIEKTSQEEWRDDPNGLNAKRGLRRENQRQKEKSDGVRDPD